MLATGNQGKVREFQEMLKDFPVEVKCLKDFGPIPEAVEDGETFDDNAYKKAHFTAKVLGLPCVKEMDGKENRKSAFHCVISIAVPSGPALTYEGSCEGEILSERRGTDGFGYDPVFYYPDFGKTFAEASMEEKNKVSHRGQALQVMAGEFDQVLKWLEQRLAEEKDPKPDHEQFEHNDWSEEVMVRNVK